MGIKPMFSHEYTQEEFMNTNKKWLIYWIHLPWHVDLMTQGYVGYTANYDRRMDDHRRDLTARIGHAWDTLKVTILAEFDSLQDAKDYERSLRDDIYLGWNIAKGGGGGMAYFHTEEIKSKRRRAQRLEAKSPAGLARAAKHSEFMKGRKATDETRAKMSASRRNPSEEYRRKQSVAQTGLRMGSKNPAYKGAVIGTSIETGDVVRFEGSAEMMAGGFDHTGVGKVINGNWAHYKGRTWVREPLPKN